MARIKEVMNKTMEHCQKRKKKWRLVISTLLAVVAVVVLSFSSDWNNLTPYYSWKEDNAHSPLRRGIGNNIHKNEGDASTTTITNFEEFSAMINALDPLTNSISGVPPTQRHLKESKQPNTKEESSSGGGGGSPTTTSLNGLRVLVAIASYDLFTTYDKFVSVMLKSFRYLCKAGSNVSVVIYHTETYPSEIEHKLLDMSQCQSSTGGSMDISLHREPKSINYLLTFQHRQLFYQHLDEFDLFIYSEDDHLIHPRHVKYFLEETNKIRNWTRQETFEDYSVGFMRYEINDHGDKVMIDPPHIESIVVMDNQTTTEKKEKEGEASFTNNYFRAKIPHQGMYMALPEQLRAWRDRPNCNFDKAPETPKALSKLPIHQPEVNKSALFREQVSSLWLLGEPFVEATGNNNKTYGCKVQQMIPHVGWVDSLVHHMSNKHSNRVDIMYNISTRVLADKLDALHYMSKTGH